MINWAALLELLYIISQASKAQETKNRKKGKRKRFTMKTRSLVLFRQRNKCAECFSYLKYADFHHLDRDRTNNHISNCQALCPSCHAKKTRKNRTN